MAKADATVLSDQLCTLPVAWAVQHNPLHKRIRCRAITLMTSQHSLPHHGPPQHAHRQSFKGLLVQLLPSNCSAPTVAPAATCLPDRITAVTAAAQGQSSGRHTCSVSLYKDSQGTDVLHIACAGCAPCETQARENQHMPVHNLDGLVLSCHIPTLDEHSLHNKHTCPKVCADFPHMCTYPNGLGSCSNYTG